MSFLVDGFSTIVTLLKPGLTPVILMEREVQPPGVDGGGGIDTTTMRNVGWRTKWNKHLASLEDLTMQCQYDPVAYSTLVNNFLQQKVYVTVTFPDASSFTFFGWVESFKPSSHKEGDFPLAEVKIIPSLQGQGMSILNPSGVYGGSTMISSPSPNA